MRLVIICVLCLLCTSGKSQDNYEIQVYGSQTVEKGETMVELHSNYTLNGSKQKVDGVLPTQHIIHETLEITHGFSSWFEIGFYVFSAIGDNNRTSFVGSHIRPRVAVPAAWHWPFGASFSAEYGFQDSKYSANTSTLELRPILDKKIKALYVSLNPVFGKSFKGVDQYSGFIFSPNAKISYDINRRISPGLEYYGSTGPFFHFSDFQQQQHQLFAAVDFNISPVWEFNAGFGYGFTRTTDRSILKFIIGRKI